MDFDFVSFWLDLDNLFFGLEDDSIIDIGKNFVERLDWKNSDVDGLKRIFEPYQDVQAGWPSDPLSIGNRYNVFAPRPPSQDCHMRIVAQFRGDPTNYDVLPLIQKKMDEITYSYLFHGPVK